MRSVTCLCFWGFGDGGGAEGTGSQRVAELKARSVGFMDAATAARACALKQCAFCAVLASFKASAATCMCTRCLQHAYLCGSGSHGWVEVHYNEQRLQD